MRVNYSQVSIGPARPLPDATESPEDSPAITDLGPTGLQQAVSLRTFDAGPGAGNAWVAQSCEGAATLLDASGEQGPWPYAIAGSAIGMVLGVMGIAEARSEQDGVAVQTALFKIGLGGLGVIAGSGLLHGYPSLQGAIEAARTVLGSATPQGGSTALATYRGIGLGSANR